MGRTAGPTEPEGGSYAAIYRVVAAIPEGKVASYGQIAALAGLPGHARQVGYALHALPDELDLPWQRVINSKGEVSLRSPGTGSGREGYQRHLLEEEGVEFDRAGRVDLARFGWDPVPLPKSKGPRGAKGKTALRLAAIEKLLLPLGSPERAAQEKAYLKSDLRFWGIGLPTLRRAVRAYWKESGEPSRAELVAVAEALWKRPVHELRSFAIETLTLHQRLLEADDLPLLEHLLRNSFTWAYVDAIAVHLVGPLIERHPRVRPVRQRLDAWVRDGDRWIRRSALLALLLPLRRGAGEWERFARYADRLLDEEEFFIRKAIGWVLREVGKRHPERVRDFLAPRIDRVAGLTLREAVKFLPERDRRRLLASYAVRRASGAAPRPSRRSAIDERRKR